MRAVVKSLQTIHKDKEVTPNFYDGIKCLQVLSHPVAIAAVASAAGASAESSLRDCATTCAPPHSRLRLRLPGPLAAVSVDMRHPPERSQRQPAIPDATRKDGLHTTVTKKQCENRKFTSSHIGS